MGVVAPDPTLPTARALRAVGAAGAAGAAAAVVAAVAVVVVRAARGLPTAMGAGRPALRATAQTSPNAPSGTFANHEAPVPVRARTIARAMLTRGDVGRPNGVIPLAPAALPVTAGELAVTWYGHSSVLIEVDGHRILADPMWSERASPSPTIGPRRLHPIPMPLSGLPPVDAVLISHDHYDHLDLPTIMALRDAGGAPFVVPLGIGAHLRQWGVSEDRIVELDWGGSHRIGTVELGCTRARHFSGRGLGRNTTQWSSWAVNGPRHRAFFGGDTGYTSAFAEIGGALGPFDLTILPIGAYADLWPDIHMTPEEALRAHLDLARPGAVLVPVHWATFNLGFHGWAEPVQRLVSAASGAASTAAVQVAVPRPGARIDATAAPAPQDWWSPLA